MVFSVGGACRRGGSDRAFNVGFVFFVTFLALRFYCKYVVLEHIYHRSRHSMCKQKDKKIEVWA